MAPHPNPRISVIIAALDEERALPLLLQDLQALREGAAEVIVVDGGSRDATVEVARSGADRLLRSGRGRALQMNAGAGAARGALLLFLHADTRFPAACVRALEAVVRDAPVWGFFRVRLRGRSPLLPLIAGCMGLRSRLSGIATGDQGLLVSRSLFEAVGKFPAQPLMEDVEICKRLRSHARPLRFATALESSGRRWDRDGALRTILLMWSLRLRYFLGAEPARLHERYYR